MRRIVTFGLCALAVPMLAAGQTKDNFEYWDTNQNGDLTCPEAKDGPDGGLRLPAYEDDRDGTGIIYQWLERSRSSDTDNDGVACESTPNAGGYVPNVQPVEPPQGCPADAETWRGLQICEEQPREGYDRDAFGSAYSSLEDDIIDMLPPTMKAGGQVYTPYTSVPHFQDHASDNWEPEGAGSDGVVNRSWSGRRSNMLSWSTCSIW